MVHQTPAREVLARVSRLPAALQPAWPLFKRAHRILALVLGLVFRRTACWAGARRLPHTATQTSEETAARESQTVMIHHVGPAEHLVRGVPRGSPPDHWAFHAALEVEVPARYVLEIAGGTAVAEHGANITPGGILDYQSSDYFGLESWREHPIFLSPQLPPVQDFSGRLLNLTTRGASNNYYHFMFDVLPRLGVFEESMSDHKVDSVLVPHQARYQRELLEMVGLSAPMLQPQNRKAVRADCLVVPSNPNKDLTAPRWVTQWLRDRLPPSGANSDARRLYLTRGDRPNTRRYVYEAELWPALERRGFARLDPGTLSVQEQIDLFSAAEVVVGPHGAALTNIVFCRPGARVLELFAGNYVHLGLWAISQSIDGISYQYVVDHTHHPVGKPMSGVLDDVRIPPARLLEAVDALLA